MKKGFPFGEIAAKQQLNYCSEFLNVAILTLDHSLVACSVASLDMSPCKELTAVNWQMILDKTLNCSSQHSGQLRGRVTIIFPQCLGTSEGSF